MRFDLNKTIEAQARELLKKYLETNTAYKLSKETGVKQPTITRFAENDTSMKLITWDRLLPEIIRGIND